MTHAPLIVKDKVIVGTAGGEYGIRGFIAAYDAQNRQGSLALLHDSRQGRAWQRNLGRRLVEDRRRVGVGDGILRSRAEPDLLGRRQSRSRLERRQPAGDNLYTDSVVALDPDTGKLKWYYQFSPHDEFDYDAVQVPVLVDMHWKGSPRKVMLWANRNGMFYVLDRTTGKFLFGKPFVEVNWMNGFDEKGRPMRVPGKVPSPEGTVISRAIRAGRTGIRRRTARAPGFSISRAGPIIRRFTRSSRSNIRRAALCRRDAAVARADGAIGSCESEERRRRLPARCGRSIRRPAI